MRSRTILSLALLLPALASSPVLAAEKAKQTVAPPSADESGEEFQVPPAGSPEDQALWTSGRDAGRNIRISRTEASRLQRATRTAKVSERLEAAAKGKPAAESAAILALKQRLMAQWKENHAIMARRWPVEPTRGCGYALLHFESALRSKAANSARADVGTARAELKTCSDRATLAVKVMTTSNETFAATLDEAVKRLAELEPAAPGAGSAEKKAPEGAAR